MFASEVLLIDDPTAARMTPTSWRQGCPVGLEDLRLLHLSHWTFDGAVAQGELVVHADHAEGIVSVFAALFDARFPIERMELVDEHGGDDQVSMRANNTSGFNCREVAYSPGRWSNHAFGTAIDINPLINPYVQGDFIDPPTGADFADRSVPQTGMILPGDVVVQAFAAIGWSWGGNWTSAKDYQHFSASGT